MFNINNDYKFSQDSFLTEEDFDYIDKAYDIFEDLTVGIRDLGSRSSIQHLMKDRVNKWKYYMTFMCSITFNKNELGEMIEDITKFDELFNMATGDKFYVNYQISDSNGVKIGEEKLKRFLKRVKTTSKINDCEVIKLGIYVNIRPIK